jgi:Icc-related predicted phosphoesterase
MKIWHISDTHMNHGQLTIPSGIDMVVHSGDASNYRDPFLNESQLRAFFDWLSLLPIKHKVFVPGNHDTSLERGLLTKDFIESLGITALINEEKIIEGIKFWGSPFTPTFGDWSYMTGRNVIYRIWELIPEDADVVITHGPPYGVLDSTYSYSNKPELAGCKALMKRARKVNPKVMMFGHIHSVDDIRNAGTRTISGMRTVFSNGSCCDDGKMGKVTSNGNILLINEEGKE